MNIYFSGAQGTGKTSIMDRLTLSYHDKITGITRKVIAKNGGNNNMDSDDTMQAAIFDAYLNAQKSTNLGIFERSIIDVFAYTVFQHSIGKVSNEEFQREKYELRLYLLTHKDEVYIYFPCDVFEPEKDEYRSGDVYYQREISKVIQDIFYENGQKYHYLKNKTITGRVREVKRVIKEAIEASKKPIYKSCKELLK